MRVSSKGLDLIKEFEGFSSKPYLCPAGLPTIGYGNTFYPNGKRVTLEDSSITKKEATQILENVAQRDFGITINKLVIVPLNQNQYDALVSFVYNIGVEAFSKSTLLNKLNKGDYLEASKEFKKWNKMGGKVLAGLTKRREKEKILFITL